MKYQIQHFNKPAIKVVFWIQFNDHDQLEYRTQITRFLGARKDKWFGSAAYRSGKLPDWNTAVTIAKNNVTRYLPEAKLKW